MTLEEVVNALERVKQEFQKAQDQNDIDNLKAIYPLQAFTKGGYYRVGNVAIKIAEITELK